MKAEARPATDSIPLHFCQRCGISIPVSDIESGRAQAAPGGFVCLACSYQGGVVDDAAGRMPLPAPVDTRRDGGLRVLAAIALLYVVGATTFLLIREATREPPVLDLGGLATARDLEQVTAQLDAVEGRTRDTLAALAANDDVQRGDLRGIAERLDLLQTQAEAREAALEQYFRTLDQGMVELAERTVGLKRGIPGILEELRSLRARVDDVGSRSDRAREPAEPARDEPAEPAEPERSAEDIAREKQVREYIAVLQDEKADEQKRYDAAVNLGDLRDPLALKPLMQALSEGDDTLIKRAGAWALGRLGQDAVPAIPVLIEEIGGKEPYVGYTCVNSLKAITKEALGAPADVGRDFDPTMGARDRRKVQKLWQDWWETNRKVLLPGD